MYDAKGKWHCKRFEDCFSCPYEDCQREEGCIPGIDIKKKFKKRTVKAGYYRTGSTVYYHLN